jgi:hypothetical protein
VAIIVKALRAFGIIDAVNCACCGSLGECFSINSSKCVLLLIREYSKGLGERWLVGLFLGFGSGGLRLRLNSFAPLGLGGRSALFVFLVCCETASVGRCGSAGYLSHPQTLLEAATCRIAQRKTCPRLRGHGTEVVLWSPKWFGNRPLRSGIGLTRFALWI